CLYRRRAGRCHTQRLSIPSRAQLLANLTLSSIQVFFYSGRCMIGKRKDKDVLVYSMGRDGSAPVYRSLSICKDLKVRQIFTLDRAKIAQLLMRPANTVPDHVRESEKILNDELPTQKPFHFITMVHDPFTRHINQSFHWLHQGI